MTRLGFCADLCDKVGIRHRQVIRISCSASDSYERFIANGLDPARNEFVHPSYGFSGANEDYKVPDPEPGDSERGFSFMIKFRASAGKSDASISSERPTCSATVCTRR